MIRCLECNTEFRGRFNQKGKKCPNCKKRLYHFIYFHQDNKIIIYSLNRYLDVRKSDNETKIYVNGEYFSICKALFLNIPLIKAEDHKTSEIEDYLRFETTENRKFSLSPEDEFWGHCSNLEAWVENEYHTGILLYNLSFPLLKALVKCGDKIAKKVFKEEIIAKVESKNPSVLLFLLEEGYFNIFTEEEVYSIFEILKSIKNIDLTGSFLKRYSKKFSTNILKKIILESEDYSLLIEFRHLFETEEFKQLLLKSQDYSLLIQHKEMFDAKELIDLFKKTNSKHILFYLAFKKFIDKNTFIKFLNRFNDDEIFPLINKNKILDYLEYLKVRFFKPLRINIKGRADLISTEYGFTIRKTPKTEQISIMPPPDKVAKAFLNKYIVCISPDLTNEELNELETYLKMWDEKDKKKEIKNKEEIIAKLCEKLSMQ